MNLHPESRRLAAHLASLEAEDAPVSALSQYAAQTRAAQTRAAAPSYLSRAKGLFSWFEGETSGLITKSVKKATALGLAVPYDRDIARLGTMSSDLRSKKLRAQSVKNTQLTRLLNLHSPSADLFYENKSSSLPPILASLDDASAKIQKALTTAEAARKLLSQGRIPGQYTAIFAVQKKLADTAYGRSRSAADAWISDVTRFAAAQARAGTPTASSYVRAAGSTFGSFAGKASGMAQWAGQEAEQAGAAIAKGAPAANAVLKYWPYLLAAGGALYALQFLPKPAPKAQ